MSSSSPQSTAFARPEALSDWLEHHHRDRTELWVRIYKKASGTPSVTWKDCVIECIRFGWIDGQKQSLDDVSYLQRLTPRRPRSNWSVKNREHADRLIAVGCMMPAGMAQVEAAMADGRWDAAYEGSANMTIPQDFLDTLETVPAAKANFEKLKRQDLFTIYHRLHSAKRPETRAKRMASFLDQLERGDPIT